MVKIFYKNGFELPYEINYRGKTRITIRAKNGVLHITATKHVSIKHIHQILDKRFYEFYQMLSESKTKVESDSILMLWGSNYQLVIVEGNFKYQIDGSIIYVKTRQNVDDTKKMILKKETENKLTYFQERIKPQLIKEGIPTLPMKVKYLKSKFGSYHNKNKEITINSFLARLDEEYLYYVLCHEYAHVKVFNHSKDFYQVLLRLHKDYGKYQKGLKKIAII